MRFFYVDEYDEDGDNHLSLHSEDDIKRDYYPYWYTRMCQKYGQDYVDANYTFEHCLADWVVINWAWEKDGGMEN